MRKPEQRVYDAMKANCADGVRLERIENAVGSGLPDVHCLRHGVTRWVELKALKQPKRANTPLFKKKTMRRDQVAWHLSYNSAGGRSFILARDDKRVLYLFPGYLAGDLREFPHKTCEQFIVMNWEVAFAEIFK